MNNYSWPVKWLNTPPKSFLGVIVYLAKIEESQELNRSLSQLRRLLIENSRPVVIFHEGDFQDETIQRRFATILSPTTPLAFERIDISNNTNQPVSVHGKNVRKYSAMCRFFTLMIQTHPLVKRFSFYWRMDTHSYLVADRPIADPFKLMQRRGILFAFIMTNEEGPGYATNLWPLFQQFLRENCLSPSSAVRQTQTTWFHRYSLDIIFNNFAIASLSLWSDFLHIQLWLDQVDRNGGIFRYRWGDAPIHTLAFTQFIERNRIVRLRYFGYFHRREYVCADGINDKQCHQMVSSLFTVPEQRFIRYEDGCFLPHAALCHYYPKVTNETFLLI